MHEREERSKVSRSPSSEVVKENEELSKTTGVAHSARTAGSGKTWSVQISADAAKNVADIFSATIKTQGGLRPSGWRHFIEI